MSLSNVEGQLVRVLVIKEIRQSWRSFRFPALFLILLMLAIMDPLSVRYMGEIIARFARGVTVVMPPPSPGQGVAQFLGDVVEIGLLVIIAITMGSVAGEKVSGVTTFIVTKPVSRKTYVLSKFLVLLGTVTASLAGGTVVATFYSRSLIGPVDWARTFAAAVSTWLYAFFILSTTFAASMAMPSPLAAGGTGLAVHIATALAGAVLGKSALSPYLPSVLPGNANAFLLMGSDVDVVARLVKPGMTSVVLSLLLLALGYRAFKRQSLP